MANLKSFAFVVSSFLVALLLITKGPDWAETFGRKYDRAVVAQSKVAQVVSLEGRASRRAFGKDEFVDLTLASWLENLDTIQIQSRGKMQVSVGQYKLALQGPGLFVLELWHNSDPTSPLVLHVLSGQMYVLSEGAPGKLYVTRGGELLDPKGASVVKERRILMTPLTISEQPKAPQMTATPAAPEAEPEGSLSNSYLDGEIAKQQDQFQRCQSNALRDQADVKGQILIGLTIAANGSVNQARVLNSTFQNDKLQNCVLQVFQRLKFKSFEGAPIVRSYPLNFE